MIRDPRRCPQSQRLIYFLWPPYPSDGRATIEGQDYYNHNLYPGNLRNLMNLMKFHQSRHLRINR
jgi:hypothetical protein